MCNECGVMVGRGFMVGVYDDHGCVLPRNHRGPHEFIDREGKRWLWETDLECDCEHCMQCEGDYCILYWEKPADKIELLVQRQGKAPDVDPRQIALF